MTNTSAQNALRARVSAIIATNDEELVGTAWHALSRVLFEFASQKLGRKADSFEMRMMLRHGRHTSKRRTPASGTGLS